MHTHFPLLASQEGIWIGQALAPDSTAYVTAECVELRGTVDLDALRFATTQALREADVLRAHIDVQDHEPRQTVTDSLVVAPQLVEVTGQSAAIRWMSADAYGGFDLRRGPLARHALLRISSDHVFWYIAAHHVALDGFAYTLLIQRAAELYNARVQGKPSSASPFSSLAATVEDERSRRTSSAYGEARTFWLSRLADMPEPEALCGRLPGVVSAPRRVERELDTAALTALDLSRPGRGPSWVYVLTALFAGFLAERTGVPELVLGLPVTARKGRVALRSPTMMMNIVPLRLSALAGSSLRTSAEQASKELSALLPHSLYRYEQLRRDLGRLGGERRLFGAVLNIMPFARTLQMGAATAMVNSISAGPVEDLSLSVHPLPCRAGLKLTFDAHPLAYDAHVLAQLADQFVAYTLERASDPERVLTNAMRTGDVVLHGGSLALPAQDVLSALLVHAHERGERVALEEHGAATSYRELMLRAQGLAERLGEHGVGAGSLVALALPRSGSAVVAMLAVLLRGAAYLPLDPGGPTERGALILEDARPDLLLGDRTTLAVPAYATLPGLCVDDVAPATCLPAYAAPADDARAYIIYTSGSTGAPNGVEVGRAALAHFVAAARERYGVGPEDRMLQFAPLAFDASVEEVFVPLVSGGVLTLRSDDMVDSAARFLAETARLGVSVLGLPTAFFHELVYAVARAGLSFPRCVRTVIIGGEAALPERVQEFGVATHDQVRLLNTYGPTETTVVACAADLRGVSARTGAPVPIGLPLAGVTTILQRRQGVTDDYELLISGPTLALGYLGKPLLTEQRFVQLGGHGRAYRTGDLVRLRDDGQLAFVGRVDGQLKISGHRVELGEVESVLQRCAGVREVVVVLSARRRLLAHVVPAMSELSIELLREHARLHLLPAAVPASFTLHQALPHTATGKLDRRLLSEIGEPLAADEAPASALESVVREVWREVLGIDQVGLDQDFFELGGQSLQSIQVATRLSLRMGREVAGALLFQNPTVRALSRALSDEPNGAPAVEGHVSARVQSDAQLARLPAPELAQTGRDVLLTGATGFLGVHLLHRLLESTDRSITCIVRADDEAQAFARLQSALGTQHLSSVLSPRVRALPGDLTAPRFGLSEHTFAQLAERCGVIVHNGASVSLARGYGSLRAVNVEATRTLIALARRSPACAVHYVSTLACALDAGHIPERFVDYHAGLQDGYSQSKWASERLLQQAHEQGVATKVYRLGRLVGALDTACVNREDLVWRMIAAGLRVGALPVLGVREPWTPVDLIARVIVASLSERDEGSTVFNLTPRTMLALDDVMRWTIRRGHQASLCAPDVFRARLLDQAAAVDPATQAMFQSQAQRAIPSIEAIETGHSEALMARARLAFPLLGEAQIHRYLATCTSEGLIEAPPMPKNEAAPAAASRTLQGDPCTPLSPK